MHKTYLTESEKSPGALSLFRIRKAPSLCTYLSFFFARSKFSDSALVKFPKNQLTDRSIQKSCQMLFQGVFNLSLFITELLFEESWKEVIIQRPLSTIYSIEIQLSNIFNQLKYKLKRQSESSLGHCSQQKRNTD